MPEALDHCQLLAMGQTHAALDVITRALAQTPSDGLLWMHKAIAHKDLLQLIAAQQAMARARSLRPHCALTRYNAALLSLLAGDDRQAWHDYEARWQVPGFPSPVRVDLPQPLWRGQDLAHGSLLLHGEQGVGDCIQFARLIPQAAERAGSLVIEVEAALLPLLAPLAPRALWIARGQALPPTTAQAPLLSLPLALGWRLQEPMPAVPYLEAPPERMAWARMRLDACAGQGVRIGLVWRGRATHIDDHHRSLPLPSLLAHLPPGPRYVSLQQPVDATEREALQRAGVANLGAECVDWSDTAALCAGLDQVVSVDTGVVHLAGALGVPTVVLLPRVPDWRWQLNRRETPWYPQMVLCRQTAVNDWASVWPQVPWATAPRVRP